MKTTDACNSLTYLWMWKQLMHATHLRVHVFVNVKTIDARNSLTYLWMWNSLTRIRICECENNWCTQFTYLPMNVKTMVQVIHLRICECENNWCTQFTHVSVNVYIIDARNSLICECKNNHFGIRIMWNRFVCEVADELGREHLGHLDTRAQIRGKGW